MDKFGIGQPVRRKEDVRLLTGRGTYTDDIDRPNQLHAFVLRSPHAHAAILSIDTAAARAAPGVAAVLTGHDAAADGIGLFPVMVDVPGKGGTKLFPTPREILQTRRVRFVGDPVALVLAETRAQAQDAAELIEVEYDILPSVTETGAALDPGAPVIWEENGSNLCVLWDSGREAEAAAGFARAARTVSLEFVQNRVVGNPMEPRVALGEYEPATGSYTLHSPTQGVMRVRDGLAKLILKVPVEKLRVISPDVGGGFGLRGKIHPESGMVLWAAKRTGRPVKWASSRSETFVSDPHGRDHVTRAEMAFDAEARVLGVKIRSFAAMGAYLQDFGPRVPTVAGGRILGTVYDIQALNAQVSCVFTNTSPTDAYRGAGRPEQAYVLERLFDLGAAEFGIGREEIRRRNYIRPEQIPYRNVAGNEIDSGLFAETQAHALALADWDGFPARRAAAAARGRLRGIGLGYFIEASGGQPSEWARVRFEEDGTVALTVGTFSHGQGHETAYAQVLHSKLGIPFDSVRFIQGDSAVVEHGNGTGGSRSSQMGGVAIARASDLVIAKGRRLAAHLLEAAAEDVEFADGLFRVAGTDLTATWQQVVAAAQSPPPGETPGLDEKLLYTRSTECNFPNGCHVAEVEIDPETGQVQIVRYAAVDDVGNVINPMLVHGQSHGGIMAGIGQALLEHAVYDRESGQFLTATFQDYCMPRASDAPDFDLGFHIVACPNNDLGVKGAGEGGACGAPPAIVSAICDALGIPHIDMPVTPEKVWRALQAKDAA
ncbi:xanthine dehydrogenase family protein molybdopterin-binding subunit [Siccirubricoccus sp. KC 17139]|uniref:Xanthine dehydrogenase family protein molybdopterin-binding subunit n=1 Tax=Siccirubricoccus soli TaxID=2899147 RepID=A0ABT1CYY8_9PROT|nr:xanthine dehydrogenase family protein molybdopterin-binding subunit [Siccirubricoccus soli]MCO6414617.1 xanthine dehydrogenase family protein molybdopterin-binding subunit [Siccirubricoccus soli]MCP2680747.1 xanthine dehydrogenase family protein molybdopterin-binding subunit [Siccirubricoccus soli]